MRHILGKRGPVEGVAADPQYLDVWVPAGRRKTLPVDTDRHAFAYVFEGSGSFHSVSRPFGVLTAVFALLSGLLVYAQLRMRTRENSLPLSSLMLGGSLYVVFLGYVLWRIFA